MEYKHADRLDHFSTGIFAAMDEKIRPAEGRAQGL